MFGCKQVDLQNRLYDVDAIIFVKERYGFMILHQDLRDNFLSLKIQNLCHITFHDKCQVYI